MKIVIMFFVILMTSGVSCEGEPFKYINNSRIILEGNLVNENLQPITNQSVILYSVNYDNTVVVKEVFSDVNGKIFLTAPKSNNSMYIKFNGKDILYTSRYNELITDSSNGDWIGFFTESYYDFGTIGLKNF